MDSNTYQRIQRVVESVGSEPANLWPTLLDEQCGGDADVRAKVEELLGYLDDGAGAFSDEGLAERRRTLNESLGEALEAAHGEPSDTWMPARIGRYAVLGIVGRGGSGVVFRARQEQPSREVALKLLSPSFATRDTVARLAREAEILARLKHPGIAQVYEAGSFDGGFGEQPYIAMELVDGLNIVDHARSKGLGRRERLRLVVEMLEAIEHAHGRGVIHRDLKPDNVLVDAEGRPKLLDFGIARVSSATMGGAAFTLEGQLLGTAAYMPPEQAGGGAAAVGPAADVFSAGAIAFELITGRRPRDVEGLSVTDALRELTGRDIPPARRIDSTVERDLETVLGKALEQRPLDRYPSAAALASDLRRFLDARPIAARAPSALDRMSKWLRRNRILAAGVAATVGVLALGLAATLVQASRAHDAEQEARRRLYGAQMLVASGTAMDPVTRGRSADLVARWAPGAPTAKAADAPGELRWEWHLLDSLQRHGAVQLDCPDPPMAVAWHPSGKLIAAAMESSIGVFSADTGQELAHIDVGDPEATLLLAVTWDAAGRRVAVSGVQRTHVWAPPPSTFEPRATPSNEPGEILMSASVPDQRALHWDADGTLWGLSPHLSAFDIKSGIETFRHPSQLIGLNRLARRPSDGKILALTKQWQLVWLDPTGRDEDVILAEDQSMLASADVDPRERYIVTATFAATACAYGTPGGERLWESKVHRETVLSCAIHPTLPLVATGSDDGTVRLLDAATGKELESYSGHELPVRCLEWRDDGGVLASCGAAGRALLWELGAQGAIRKIAAPDAEPSLIDRGRLIWNERAGELQVSYRNHHSLWRAADGTWDPDQRTIRRELMDPRGRWLARGDAGDLVNIRSARGSEVERQVEIGEDTYMLMDWDPGGDALVAGNRSGFWRVDGVGTSAPGADKLTATRIFEPGIQLTDLRVAPTGDAVAATSTYHSLFIAPMDPASGRAPIEFTLESQEAARSLCWNPGGTQIAAGTNQGRILLVDALNGELLRVLSGHFRQVMAVAWHPSGGRLASGSHDGTVKIWSTGTGALVASFPVPAHVSELLWIRGGRVLAALDYEGTVTLWDASRSIDREGAR